MAGTPPPLASLQRRQSQLERRILQLERANQRLLREALQTARPALRPVRTYLNPEETYPAHPANVYEIRFCDVTLAGWTPGNHAQTIGVRSAEAQGVAGTYDGRFILPNQLCWVVRHKRKHWIVQSPGEWYFARLLGGLSKDGSANAEIIEWDGAMYSRVRSTGYHLTVYDRFLNTGKTLATKTKVEVRLEYPGRYGVVNGYCDPDSNADSVYDVEEEEE